jgi:hypothetical protein
MSGNRNSGRRTSGKAPTCCYCGAPRPIYRSTCNKCNYELSKASRERRKAERLARAVETWQKDDTELVLIGGILTPPNLNLPRKEWGQGGYAPDGTGPRVRW